MSFRRTAAALVLSLALSTVSHADAPGRPVFSNPIQLPTEQGPLLADEGFIVGYELQEFQPELSEKIAAFIDLDTQTALDAAAMLKSFPSEVSLPLQFEAPQTTALYERLQ